MTSVAFVGGMGRSGSTLLEQALGRRALIERQPLQPGDVPQTFADITKARRLLGYNPQTPIEAGIERFVAWFNKTMMNAE